MFKLLKRKKQKPETPAQKEADGVLNTDLKDELAEKLEQKAEERTQQFLQEQLLEVQKFNQKVRKLQFVETQHKVLIAVFKRPSAEGIKKEVVTLGYVQGVAIAPSGLVVISYTQRAPTWLDEVFMSIARVFNRAAHSKLLWSFQDFTIIPALDTRIVVETSDIVETPYGLFALPPFESEEEKKIFYALYKQTNTLEQFIELLLRRAGQLTDTALTINPWIKSYKLVERTKNQKKKEERFKVAEGGEIILTAEKDIWDEFNL